LNGFSRIELQLKPAVYLKWLCLGLLAGGQLALWLLPLDMEARWLSMLSLLVVFPVLYWPLFRPHPEDEVVALVWEPDRKSMQLLTRAGSWCPVEQLGFSCSLPGLLQVLRLQRQDRALPTWLLITPERITPAERRRLHVALRWAPPPGSHPATES